MIYESALGAVFDSTRRVISRHSLAVSSRSPLKLYVSISRMLTILHVDGGMEVRKRERAAHDRRTQTHNTIPCTTLIDEFAEKERKKERKPKATTTTTATPQKQYEGRDIHNSISNARIYCNFHLACVTCGEYWSRCAGNIKS